MEWIFALLIATTPMVFGEVFREELESFGKEYSRKFIHTGSAIAIACLPFVLDLYQIAILAAAMTPMMIIGRQKKMLKAMHQRDHTSYGDVLFGVGIGLAALISNSVTIFVVSVLIMGVADGIAGLVGQGSSKVFTTPGAKKPQVGRAVFLIITILIIGVAAASYNLQITTIQMVLLAAILTVVEQISPYGSDNLTLPVVAAFALNMLG